MDLLTPPRLETDKDRFAVFADKDMRYDGHLFLGVSSTGIFCRPGCPARLPKFENASFHISAAEALADGFRACKRCHPSGGETTLIKNLITLVEKQPDKKITKSNLLSLGYDPSTVRRQFLSRFGMSFTDYARARRMAVAAKTLSTGGSVLEAQLDAGFDSSSGFRSAYAKIFGTAPKKATANPLSIDWLDTPMGRMIVIADEHALFLLEFTNRKNMRRQFDRLRRVQNLSLIHI